MGGTRARRGVARAPGGSDRDPALSPGYDAQDLEIAGVSPGQPPGVNRLICCRSATELNQGCTHPVSSSRGRFTPPVCPWCGDKLPAVFLLRHLGSEDLAKHAGRCVFIAGSVWSKGPI